MADTLVQRKLIGRELIGRRPALCGGDLVFDANAIPYARASHLYDLLYDLYHEPSRRLGVPTHRCLGNHDIFASNLQKTGKAAPGRRGNRLSRQPLHFRRGGLRQLGEGLAARRSPGRLHRLHCSQKRRLRLAPHPLRLESRSGYLNANSRHRRYSRLCVYSVPPSST